MQVKSAKCSQPIDLTDIIESDNGRLSHMDCNRPCMLTAEERALLFLDCFEGRNWTVGGERLRSRAPLLP
jgi:hypothetical protein